MRTFRGRFARARVRVMTYAPDGSALATAGRGGLIRIWDPVEGRVRDQYRFGSDRVTGLAFSPDGSTLASVSLFDGVKFRSVEGRSAAGAIREGGLYYSLDFRPDGREILTGGLEASPGTGGLVTTWSLESLSPVARLSLAVLPNSATYGPDGKSVALGADRHGILIWEPARFSDASPILDPRLSGRGPYREPTEEVARLAVPQDIYSGCLRFSPDGRLLAAAAGWSAHAYEVATRQRVATFKGHRLAVSSLDFSRDGSTLATASFDGTVRFWDVESGSERARFDWEIGQVDCLAFSPDGMTVAAGGEGGIVAWDFEP